VILRAKNWEEFQHYKDRDPPWIKLHKRLLDDRVFHRLPDASRALAPCLWLLCSETKDGTIKDAVAEISFRLRMTEKKAEEALNPLIEAGFFIVEQDASATLAPCEHDATQRQRHIEKTETEAEVAQTRSPTGSRLPEDWMPSDEDRAFAEQHGKNPHAIAPSFRDYWRGVAGAKGRKADWAATWRNWVRRETESAKAPQSKFSKLDPQALPAAEPWEQRMYGWSKSNGKFWQSTWGPKPGENGCRVPASLLASH
jgi:hypothetical protein